MPGDQPSPRGTSGGVLHPDTEGILDAAADFLWSDEVRMSCSLSQCHGHCGHPGGCAFAAGCLALTRVYMCALGCYIDG